MSTWNPHKLALAAVMASFQQVESWQANKLPAKDWPEKVVALYRECAEIAALGRCKAITRAGMNHPAGRCKNRAKAGSDFCGTHGKKEGR